MSKLTLSQAYWLRNLNRLVRAGYAHDAPDLARQKGKTTMTTLRIRVGVGETTLAETNVRIDNRQANDLNTLAELVVDRIIDALKQKGFTKTKSVAARSPKSKSSKKKDGL